MATTKWSLLSRLRRAVKKVKLLLNFNMNRWRIASIIGGRSFDRHRRCSFNDRPGLTACASDVSGSEEFDSSRGLQRTISYPSDQEDIDQKAELFIANFRKQLRMERQVSLELRYYRGNSFELKSP